MEHRDDAPLADESQAGAIPNDQPDSDVAAPAHDAAAPADDGDDEDGAAATP